jgi:hypothetical protein
MVERLPSKLEVLSFNARIAKEERKEAGLLVWGGKGRETHGWFSYFL